MALLPIVRKPGRTYRPCPLSAGIYQQAPKGSKIALTCGIAYISVIGVMLWVFAEIRRRAGPVDGEIQNVLGSADGAAASYVRRV